MMNISKRGVFPVFSNPCIITLSAAFKSIVLRGQRYVRRAGSYTSTSTAKVVLSFGFEY